MPQWTYTVRLGDVWKNPDMSFEERRDAIVDRLRRSRWLSDAVAADDDAWAEELTEVVDALAAATTVSAFDEAWNDLYGMADYDRAWIDIHSK